MSRLLILHLTVPEEKVGGILADINGRVTAMDIETVELVDRRSHPKHRTAVKAKAKPKKKKATRQTAEGTQKQQAALLKLLHKPLTYTDWFKRSKLAEGRFNQLRDNLVAAKRVRKNDTTNNWETLK